MSFRLSKYFLRSPLRGLSAIVRNPSVRLAVFTLVSMGVSIRAEAGSPTRPLESVTTTHQAPALTPKLRISKKPHLVAIGPMEIYVKPIAGPQVRRAPLLPAAKAVQSGLEAVSKPEQSPKAGLSEPVEPSAFSPDAPPTMLPTEKPPIAPAAAGKEESTESVLVPALRGEPELKDSVIYFETPVGPRGSQVSVPMAVPLTSPVPVTQPQSRATFRKEKE